MSRKHFTPQKQIFTNFNMIGAGTSLEIDCEQLDRILFNAIFTGTPQGNISVQISNDKVSWRTLPIDPLANLLGVAGACEFDISNICWKYIRLSYGFTAGVGTLNAFYKGVSTGA